MDIKRKAYYSLSPSMRLLVRRIYYLPIDIIESMLRKRNKLTPPKGMIFIGSGDFEKQGRHILDLVKKYTDLKPDGKILDIGCGIGRLAIPLTDYLSTSGEYRGFDIVKEGVDWCNKKISPSFPNFQFLHIDLKNDLYNLGTDEEAKNFAFPYPRNHFHSIVLISVFTHMMPDDVDNYLKQIATVMHDNGKCLATFFILNPEVKRRLANNKTYFQFPNIYDGYSLMDKKVKEANIAFEEFFLLSLFDKNGLQALHISQGSWSGGSEPLDFQDVVVLQKKRTGR